MTFQLILPHRPKEISTKLITYWLIIVMQFDCLHTCDLNLKSSNEPKLKRSRMKTSQRVCPSRNDYKLLKTWCDL